QLLHVGHGFVGLIIKTRVLQELSGRTFAAVQIVDDYVDLVYRGIRLAIEFIIRNQFSDGAITLADLVDQSLELTYGGGQAIVECWIVDQLADRPLPALHKGDDAVHALQQRVQVLQRALAGPDNILNVGMVPDRQHVAVFHRRPVRLRAINVNVGLAQNPGGGKGGDRIGVQSEQIFAAHLQSHFHGREFLVRVGDDADLRYVPNIHAIQAYRSADPESAGIVEERFDCDFLGE